MNENINVDYTYECPTGNYMNGDVTETITDTYVGPDTLVALIDKEHNTVEDILLPEEAADGRPDRANCINVVVDCAANPLVCEVISDYHDGNAVAGKAGAAAGDQDVRSIKTIPTPEGYSEFSYPYPIHADELFDDSETTYIDGKWNLAKNTNEGLVGGAAAWDDIRKDRNGFLLQSDQLMVSDMPEDVKAEAVKFRQLMRDLPEALADIDPVFIPSSFPPTTIVSQ